MKVKDLKYWKARGGQIEWRLAEAKVQVREMEKDLKECDENIARLQKENWVDVGPGFQEKLPYES